MNNTQLERRLRRLEETVGFKKNNVREAYAGSRTLKALSDSEARNNILVGSNHQNFDNGVAAYIGYLELSPKSLQIIEDRKPGIELLKTAVVVSVEDWELDEPFMVQILTAAKHQNREIYLEHEIESFDSEEDAFSYAKSFLGKFFQVDKFSTLM